MEAAAAQELAAEDEPIARKYDMCRGWSYDETESDYHETWCRSPAMRCGRSSSNPIVCGGAKSSRQAANSPESALNSAQIHANAAGSAR